MKQWVKKLLEQFDMDASKQITPEGSVISDMSEERATLLFVLDAYSKHLVEIDSRPIRKVRAIFDEFAKGLLRPDGSHTEKLLFRFRQFFSAYRVQEYTYLQTTFDDFKSIIWDFADQLNESIHAEQARDMQVRETLNGLREAVEANSIESLKEKSREFIDFYIELQTKNDQKRTDRLDNIQKNLAHMKKKLVEVNRESRRDHLTGAFNRKSFDETLARTAAKFNSNGTPVTLLSIDIDYFKKINDVFGHDAGDLVLKELVQLLRTVFTRDNDFVARVGGEEFAIVLPEVPLMEAVKKAEEITRCVRKKVVIHSDSQIRFTVSAGIAQFLQGESIEGWLKRADSALYQSKNSGRDQYTVAPHPTGTSSVA